MASQLPDLTPQESHKLQQLTLLSLTASHPMRPIPYTLFQDALQIPTILDLSHLFLSAISAGLMTAKLDSAREVLHVTQFEPRDVAYGDQVEMERMHTALLEWMGKCNKTIEDVESQIESALTQAKEHAIAAQQVEERITAVREAIVINREKQQQTSGMSTKALGKMADEPSETTGVRYTRKRKEQI